MAPCLKFDESRPIFGFITLGADEITQTDAVRLARFDGESLWLTAFYGMDRFMRTI